MSNCREPTSPKRCGGLDAVWRSSCRTGRSIASSWTTESPDFISTSPEKAGCSRGSPGFAVAIGCLGLIGLSAYTAERRTKEIGIRKALGASTIDVVWLLIRQFIRPVLLANVLAWPVAWWFMRDWLDGFAYRIDLDSNRSLSQG